jgi:hypothetical protein
VIRGGSYVNDAGGLQVGGSCDGPAGSLQVGGRNGYGPGGAGSDSGFRFARTN